MKRARRCAIDFSDIEQMKYVFGQAEAMLTTCRGLAIGPEMYDTLRDIKNILHRFVNALSYPYELQIEEEHEARLWSASTEELAIQRKKLMAVLASRSPKLRGRPCKKETLERINLWAVYKAEALQQGQALSMNRAARLLGITYKRARGFWAYYGKDIDTRVALLH
jgi:hypothetical protein